jgi:catechol 2,3-dioxygenase-like lactoylglutathione lyase family enzyme
MLEFDHLDQLVLTVTDIDRTCSFYTNVLGMRIEAFGNGRNALWFGKQKSNLHLAAHAFEPKANSPKPGPADLCFIVATPLEKAITHPALCKVQIEQGPVDRTSATRPITSIYLRDPGENPIELSTPKRTDERSPE